MEWSSVHSGVPDSGRAPSLMRPREQHRYTGHWGRCFHELFPGTTAVPNEKGERGFINV